MQLNIFNLTPDNFFNKLGIPYRRGYLLFGPPGCGKTLLAKAVANEAEANFISIKGPELLTMWFGESEANVREVFDKARTAAPCILFFDELDSIGKSRGSSQGDAGGAGDRVMNQLLTEMDGVTAQKLVFFLGATNRPDILDAALLRPGRLDSLIYIGLPDFDARVNIFKACFRKSPLGSDVDIDYFADATEGFSGADISGVCTAAAKCAIRMAIKHEETQLMAIAKKKKEAEDKGETYVEDEKEKKIQVVAPTITKAMLMAAMQGARRSVSETDIKRYMEYKQNLERRLGMEGSVTDEPSIEDIMNQDSSNSSSSSSSNSSSSSSSSTSSNAPSSSASSSTTSSSSSSSSSSSANRNFGSSSSGDNHDDIYG